MAKLWSSDITTGIMTRNYKNTTVETLNIDAALLFPNWLTMNDCQKQCVFNGLKQKIDDAIARTRQEKLTDKEAREVQETVANRILAPPDGEEPKWNSGVKGGRKTTSVGRNLLLASVKPLMATGVYTTAESIQKVIHVPVELIQKEMDREVEEGEE
ncbi:MAG: hypothetical protein ACTSQA_00370 [Candidatus Heimdallarchaeaceae archaeon]